MIPTAATNFEGYLIAQGLLSAPDLEKADRLRRETGASFCSAVRRSSSIHANVLARALSDFHGMPLVTDAEWQDLNLGVNGVSLAFLRENNVFPLGETDDGLLLAMEDPSDTYVIRALQLAFKQPVIPRIASADDIQSAIERTVRERDGPGILLEAEGGEAGGDDVEHLRDIALGAPIVRFVNQLIQDAVHARATDIHIEPFDGRLAIRMRIDGLLREISPPPAHMAKAIVSRVKILSGLNIAERRLPQDGRARVRINERRLDLRVATMPTTYGEAVAIRLLDNVRRALDLGRLGFSKGNEEVLSANLKAPYGLILVTGPTGSGKTTTLATALTLLNQGHRKILTIEDPIEYEIDGVNQTQAKPAIGLTFANALRSFLRHDPDIIMVGEMRDSETASIGIHAALTGHLVLSTLHTNTASGAIPRLLDMGIDAFLLASSLRCVVAQRLVRLLCSHCKAPEELSGGAINDLCKEAPVFERTQTHWRAVGCSRCFGTGYADRIVVSEVLDVNDEIRELIQPNTRPSDIEKVAFRRGMKTMLQDGLEKCEAGLTTTEEVRRVTLDI